MRRSGKEIMKDGQKLLLVTLVLVVAVALVGTPVEARRLKMEMVHRGEVSPVTMHPLGYRRLSFEMLSRGPVPPSGPNNPPEVVMLTKGPVPPSGPSTPPPF
ncbi:hypothetical protein RHGRI_010717 [Rhododendron griersonianum]|uniref:Proline-rich protein n=1 Tax=Rhododendron griersonianum TaxID=479676 RepID=A0AAV6KK82_9ERIC|nr:hypothetical protein RHGRI_010717 [Rhododendron griersonianum]